MILNAFLFIYTRQWNVIMIYNNGVIIFAICVFVIDNLED